MARLIQQLTEAKIQTLTKIGLHPDGAGLYLQIRPGGARSWIYRFTLNRHTRDQGLGRLADVSLVKAREKASAARALVDDGIDRKRGRPRSPEAAYRKLALIWRSYRRQHPELTDENRAQRCASARRQFDQRAAPGMGTEGGNRPLAGTMIALSNTRVSSLASMSALPHSGHWNSVISYRYEPQQCLYFFRNRTGTARCVRAEAVAAFAQNFQYST
jgi:hypothetical protein